MVLLLWSTAAASGRQLAIKKEKQRAEIKAEEKSKSVNITLTSFLPFLLIW